MKKYRVVLIMIIVTNLLTGCGKQAEENVEGDKKTLVIGQSMAENMIHFGLKDDIIGVSYLDGSFSKYEDELKDLNVVSKSWPSKEAVMGLNPRIIYSMESAFRDEIIGKEDFWIGNGIETLSVVDYNKGITKDNYYEDLRRFGTSFGKEKEVEDYINNLEDKIADLRERIELKNGNKILFIGGAGRGNYDFYPRDWCIIDEVIEDLGGEFIDISNTYVELSLESIIDADPDKIMITEFKNDNEEKMISEFKEKPLLNELNAVKNDAILVVDYTASIRGGMGLEDLYESVANFLMEGDS